MPKKDLTLITPQQAIEIRAEINHLEKMLQADRRSRSPKIQDEAEFMAEIKKKKDILEKHAPRELRGRSKDNAWKRVKELDAFIKEHMPSKREYFMRPTDGGVNDFERAVRQQMKFQSDPKIQRAVQERKYWMGRLEPKDPTVRNIENLRR